MESAIQYINNQLAIPAFWLYEPYRIGNADMPAIMSYKTYDNKRQRKQIISASHPGPGKPAMIVFDRLPENIKMLINARVGGSVYKAAKRNFIEREIKPDYEAAQFFTSYAIDGVHLHHNKQALYTLQACIFNVFTHIINNRKSMQYKHLCKTKGEMWANFSEELNELQHSEKQELKGHKLPDNPRRLQAKYELYVKEGYVSLIHGGHGNANGLKTPEEEQKAMLNGFLSKGDALDNVQIANLYNIAARTCGWKQISEATVANRRAEMELENSGGLKGLNHFRNQHTMQVKRKAPECALYFCTCDGWDAELLYQQSGIDTKGHSVTTYHNRLTIVVVLDTSCKYPVGYAIGNKETPELIQEAWYNAVLHIEELFGQKYQPLQIQSDNYGRGALKPMFTELAAKYYTPAAVGNAKAKVIEPWFNYFNKTYLQMLPNWSGFGVTSKKGKCVNQEWVKANKKNFPDREGCAAQLHAAIRADRQKLISTYRAKFDKLPAEHKNVLSDEQFLYLFGNETGKTNKLQHYGVAVQLLGETRYYDCFDVNFRTLQGMDWVVKYNPNNLKKALAVSKCGKHRFTLEEKYVQPMALIERTEEDSAELQRVRDFNNNLEQIILDHNQHTAELIEETFSKHPQLNDTLVGLVLTDSRGRHKDQRNELRNNKNELRSKTEKLAAKQERKEIKQAVKLHKEEFEEYLDNKVDLSKYL